MRDEQLFDTALLEQAHLPDDPALDRDEMVFLWQPPSPQTLAHLETAHPRAPLLVGRFESETPVHDARIP